MSLECVLVFRFEGYAHSKSDECLLEVIGCWDAEEKHHTYIRVCLPCFYHTRVKLWKQGVHKVGQDAIYFLLYVFFLSRVLFQEKRCFAVFSPVFENPFGAILFEAGQLKYSMKILNALEGETFAVQFLGSQDVSVCDIFYYETFELSVGRV